MVSVYSVVHFIVDFSCAFIMFSGISQSPDWYLCILIYNFCAFAVQMPIGIIADKLNRNYIFAGAGCVFIAIAFGLVSLPLAATVVVGIGNGMFHIGGGVDVLNISDKKSGALGVFVSPGAFGVYFGTILGKGSGFPSIPVLIALFASAGVIFVACRAKSGAFRGSYINNAVFSPRIPSGMVLAVICLGIVVCLRSYVGFMLSFPWKSNGYWALALVFGTVFGKTAGGFLSDKFGPVKTAVFTLGLAALLFLFPQIPVAGLASVLLFNMTMPITLWAVARIIPGAKGFSFGLLTFALFLGFLPTYLSAAAPPTWVFTLLSVMSIILLTAALRKPKSNHQ